MYKKVMVPLDGSELAECVLPHLETFIKGFKINDVHLVRVIEPEVHYRGEHAIDPEIVANRESERESLAREYLDGVVNRVTREGATINTDLVFGRVTESLADFAQRNNIDLILIATHGRSGITRWVRGSVADKVLRSANVPVLMVRAPGSKGGI
ncbi:universal stress protein [Thermodesulfobacteriota bacterium]